MIGKAVITFAVCATLLYLLTGILGFGVADEDTTRTHLLLGLLSVVSLVFIYSWVLIYLAGLAGLQKIAGASLGVDIEARAEWRHSRRVAIIVSSIVIVLALATIGAGAAGVFRSLPYGAHALLSGVSLAAQLAAIWAVRKALLSTEQFVGLLERAAEGAG